MQRSKLGKGVRKLTIEYFVVLCDLNQCAAHGFSSFDL